MELTWISSFTDAVYIHTMKEEEEIYVPVPCFYEDHLDEIFDTLSVKNLQKPYSEQIDELISGKLKQPLEELRYNAVDVTQHTTVSIDSTDEIHLICILEHDQGKFKVVWPPERVNYD